MAEAKGLNVNVSRAAEARVGSTVDRAVRVSCPPANDSRTSFVSGAFPGVTTGVSRAVEAYTAGTIGIPQIVVQHVGEVRSIYHPFELDTYGLGLANCLAALKSDVTYFESAFGGLGGCPFTKVPAGNVSTEESRKEIKNSPGPRSRNLPGSNVLVALHQSRAQLQEVGADGERGRHLGRVGEEAGVVLHVDDQQVARHHRFAPLDVFGGHEIRDQAGVFRGLERVRDARESVSAEVVRGGA